MTQMSIKSSLGWMGGASIVGQVITWSITIIVARMLTPGDYGLVALSGLFTVFAISISEMGVGAAVIQRDEITPHQMSALYSLSILMGGAMTLVGILMAPVLAYIFNEPRIIPLTQFQSFLFMISALKSMQRTALVRNTRFDVIAKLDTGSRVLTSFCTLGLAYMGAGPWALAAQWLFIELYQFLAYAAVSRIRPALHIRFVEVKDVLSFGFGVMARNIVYKIYSMADVTILGKIASKEFLGGYTFAKQLTGMPFEKVLTLVNQVLFPYLSRAKKDLAVMRDWTVRSAEIQAFTLVPFFIMLFFCAEEAVVILLGPNWQAAIFPMRIFCVANIFKLIENYNGVSLTSLGHVRVTLVYNVVQLVVIVSGFLLLSQFLSPMHSIYVWILFYPFPVLWLNNFLVRRIGLSYRLVARSLAPFLFAQAVLIAVLLGVDGYFQAGEYWSLAVKVIVGATVYLLAIWFMDKSKIMEMLGMVIKRKPALQGL